MTNKDIYKEKALNEYEYMIKKKTPSKEGRERFQNIGYIDLPKLDDIIETIHTIINNCNNDLEIQQAKDNVIIPLLMTIFVKDPNKQSPHEKEIKSKNPDFEKLPTKNGFYLNKGKITRGQKHKSKSLDFRFKINDIVIWIVAKRAKGAGGGQDNEFTDVRQSLEDVILFCKKNSNDHFWFICEGIIFKNFSTLEKMVPKSFRNRIYFTDNINTSNLRLIYNG